MPVRPQSPTLGLAPFAVACGDVCRFPRGSAAVFAARGGREKSLFNSLDMDGTVGAWRTRMGLVDGERTLAGFRVDLGPAGSFDFGQYRRAMAVGTAWLAGRMPAMREFVVMHLRNIRDARSVSLLLPPDPSTTSARPRARPLCAPLRGCTMAVVGPA